MPSRSALRALSTARPLPDQRPSPPPPALALNADADTLYVDCSAGAIQPPSGRPVFDGDTIRLFMVRWCQPTFSAALIAYVESHYSDAAEMNALCAVVPSPEQPIDWLRMWSATLTNMARWHQQPTLQAWLMQCRLNAAAVMMRAKSVFFCLASAKSASLKMPIFDAAP